MTEKIINSKDVAYVAKLARVEIKAEDVDKYAEQLEKILGYVGQLKEKNTEGVIPTAHPFEVSNVWREDEVVEFKDRDKLFKNAPEMEETYYRVKKIIE